MTRKERYGKVDRKEARMPYKSRDDKRKHDRDYIKKRRGTTFGRDDRGGTTRERDPRAEHLAEALIDPVKRSKLILLSNALDKTMTGLDGKPLRLSSIVHYGYYLGKRVFEGEYGFAFDKIKELL